MTSNQNMKIKFFYFVLFYERENDLFFKKKNVYFFEKIFHATPMIKIKKFTMIESDLLVYFMFNN